MKKRFSSTVACSGAADTEQRVSERDNRAPTARASLRPLVSSVGPFIGSLALLVSTIVATSTAIQVASQSEVGAETVGQAIVAAAQGIQSQAYPQESFSSAAYIYCFGGGTTTGASSGKTDPYTDGSYSNCGDIGRVGFDCRGLALYAVYQGTGDAVTLPTSTAQAQYSDASSYEGSYISLSSVETGDLVFFGSSSSNIEHVGMVVSGTGSSAEIISAVSENYGIATETVQWFEGEFNWVGAVAIPGVDSSGGSGSPPPDGVSEESPAMVLNQASNFDLDLVQGPEYSLDGYWDTIGQSWSGPQTVAGADTTYSAPAMVLNQSTNFVMAAVEGPNNSLDVYWQTIGQSWNGPAQFSRRQHDLFGPGDGAEPDQQLHHAYG